jgi:8-oxo-dGTP pyrophosphatase MutT (NUDIX family)
VGTSDGNGWVACRCGRRHWGLFGAAGVLLVRLAPADGDGDVQVGPGAGGDGTGDAAQVEVLLQQRAPWVHEGGSWGVPGGAADSHEDAVAAALREADEEAGIGPLDVDVVDVLVSADHGDWRYDLVLAAALPSARPRVANEESDAIAWVRLDDVPTLRLHPGFAIHWPAVRATLDAYEPHTWRRDGPS